MEVFVLSYEAKIDQFDVRLLLKGFLVRADHYVVDFEVVINKPCLVDSL